jgi:hypothetical protein
MAFRRLAALIGLVAAGALGATSLLGAPVGPTPTGSPLAGQPSSTANTAFIETADPGPSPSTSALATVDPTQLETPPLPTPRATAQPSRTEAPPSPTQRPGGPTSTPKPPSPTPTPTPTPPPPPPGSPAIALGAYIPGAPSDPSKIDAYAKLTGAMPHIVHWFQAWSGSWNAFPTSGANAVRARGAMPLISWEPSAGKATDPNWTLQTIISGNHDSYIRSWTKAVANWGHPLYVRLMYEMNGPWNPWGTTVNGGSNSKFIAAWRHVVTVANAQGATNIRWVWCPNNDPYLKAGPYSGFYPGSAYVDWVCLDGYNWGTTTSDPKWRSITTIFKTPIARLRAFTSKPLLIGETASNGTSAKADWILNGLGRIQSLLPAVRAVIWYDKPDPGSGVDWRVNSSSVALSAFRQVAMSKAFAGHLT